MTNKSELKLAPGSRWSEEAVVSVSGEEVWIHSREHAESQVYIHYNETNGAPISDVLAVIRAAGLDPEFERLKVLEAENATLLDRCTTAEANESAALTERDLLLKSPNHWRDEAWRLQTENAELRSKVSILEGMIHREEA